MSKTKIPEWALFWKRKGTVLQMVGDLCCIYTTKSHWDKGKKYPSVERKYMGVVTPNGVVAKADVNIDKGDVEVWEAGFTDFILANIPENLVEPRNFSSEDERAAFQDALIANIVLTKSEKSYLGRTKSVDKSIKGQVRARYERRYQHLVGVTFEELECLKDVYLIAFQGGLEARSRMNELQMAVYSRHGIPFPWERKVANSVAKPPS